LARRSGVNVSRLDDLVREMAAKWESLNPLELPEVTPDERARIMGAYIEHRHTFGYTLLNELPDLLRGALRDHADLDGVKFDLLIVDEYQDLNACELELLKRLGERGASILSIGDDDQSIYSFRKAHPIGIRRFTDDYPSAKDYALSICQRLPQKIAQWAQFVIAGQVGRRRQPIQCKPGAPMGTVALLNFGSEVTEARGIADLIDWLHQSEGIPLSEILILSRTDYRGTFTRRIRDELDRRNIVVFDQSQVGRILGEPQNRKLLALLRVAVNRRDSLAWWTLIHLERGIGPKFIDSIYEAAVGTGTTFGESLVDAGEAGFPEFADAIKRRVVKFYKATVETVEQLEIPTASPDIKWGEWINSLNGSVSESTEELKALLGKIDETYPDAADGLDRYLSSNPAIQRGLSSGTE